MPTPDNASLFDFNDGNGPVPAHRHINPDGTLGGWVADTAVVYGNAVVSGDARVYGDAVVYGNARVSGNARVYGDARVSGNARVSGDAKVHDLCTILWGRAGGYDWTAYPCADDTVFLQYGCEAHPLSWWMEQTEALSLKHGEPAEHWRFPASVIRMVSDTLTPPSAS